MHTVMWVPVCSPGPPPNVPPYMVPMCVLVGAGLSEPQIYCVYRSLCTCMCPHVVLAWQVLTKMADVLTITFMLYAIPKHKILDVESLPHAVWL